MKNLKKTLSVFLALCMMLVYVPVFSASAEDGSSLSEVESRVEAYDGVLDTAEPDADDLAEFEAIVSMYRSLSESEKEQMDVCLFDKLYHLSIDREMQVSIINNPAVKATNSKHKINAGNQTRENFGGLPAYLDEAVTLYTTVNNSKVSAEDKLSAFASASVNARIYAGYYNTSYKMFYNPITKHPGKCAENIVNALYKDYIKADPFSEASIKRPSKPNANKYADGVNDPEYIEAYNAYWEQETAYQMRAAREKNHSADLYLKALYAVAAVAEEYEAPVNYVSELIEAKKAYDADNSDISLASAAVEKYASLTKIQKLFIDNLSYSFLYSAVNKGTSYSVTGYTAAKLYSACEDIGNAYLVNEFINGIAGIEAPYGRADIDKAKALYAKVPATLASTLPDETVQKYRDILASIGYDVPSDEKPDVSNMPSADISYPVSETGTYKTARNLFNAVAAFSDSDAEVFASDIRTKVFSSEFIGTVIKWLYPLLGNLSSLVSYSPADVAGKLTEEKYAKAVEKLISASKDEDGNIKEDITNWDNLAFENGDFGFEDGDKEAFLDALSACFRQLSLLPLVITLENEIDTSAGTYTYGAYEDLIGIFEALDLDGVVSSDDYTKLVSNASDEMKMDARIRPILAPVANLIDEFADAPLDTVLNELPKLGYTVSSGILNDQINALISKVRMIPIEPVDLTSGGLFDILDKKLNALINDKLFDGGSDISVDFHKDSFVSFMSALAGCGDYTVRDSVARGRMYRAGIDSNKTGAVVFTWNYIYDVISDKNNTSSVKSVIGALDISPAARVGLKALTGLAPKMSSGAMFKLVVFVTAILHFFAVIKPYITKFINVLKS